MVDEDNVRMSEFIKEKLHIDHFEYGQAFYEFDQAEDLLYYKDIVLLPEKGTDKVL